MLYFSNLRVILPCRKFLYIYKIPYAQEQHIQIQILIKINSKSNFYKSSRDQILEISMTNKKLMNPRIVWISGYSPNHL